MSCRRAAATSTCRPAPWTGSTGWDRHSSPEPLARKRATWTNGGSGLDSLTYIRPFDGRPAGAVATRAEGAPVLRRARSGLARHRRGLRGGDARGLRPARLGVGGRPDPARPDRARDAGRAADPRLGGPPRQRALPRGRGG